MRKLLFIFLCFLSCQDEISLEFPIESQKLVIEGGIEPNMPPYVILSKNQGYFDEINANTYNDLFIYDAEVVVWTLDENGVADSVYLQPLPPPLDSIPVFTDINYLFSLTNPPYANSNGYPFSKENKTYNLIVRWNNEEITSQTTIPTTTPLDCLWVEKNEFTDKEYEFDIRAIYDDPAEVANNILLKYRKPIHWKVDTVNWVLEENNDDLMELIDAGTDILKKEGGGQIVAISSVAGFRGLSSTPAYSASKAALSTYMEGIRNKLKEHKIVVTVLNPGFIDTPINTHRKSRPFVISAEKGARLMADMIEKKIWSSAVPVWPWSFITKIMRLVPERLWSKINV